MNQFRHLPLVLAMIVIVLLLGERASYRAHLVPPKPIEVQNWPKPEETEDTDQSTEAIDPSFAGGRKLLERGDMSLP